MRRIIPLLIVVFLVSCSQPEVKPQTEETQTESHKNKVSQARLYYSFGADYLMKRNYDDAIKNFQRALKESTDFESAAIGLGKAYQGKRILLLLNRPIRTFSQRTPRM